MVARPFQIWLFRRMTHTASRYSAGSIRPTLAGPAIDEFAPNDSSSRTRACLPAISARASCSIWRSTPRKKKAWRASSRADDITTLTGQEAKFLSGGEFPIPVPQGLNTVTIEFNEFGVGLKFLPVVLNSGHINLRERRVSEL